LALSIEKVEKSVKNEMVKDLVKDKMAMVNFAIPYLLGFVLGKSDLFP